ncbi:MAG: DNA repair protein RecO [Woeseiaceae bacterium]|nr:DNA repair protein RecO [Woeseiaceae bacterium]
MTASQRVQQQPAYVLHHRAFRDSSQILDLVTRDHGKVALVARGSRGARSRLAGVLRPFLPLSISWVSRSDLGTLTGAEATGTPAGVSGDAMLAAFYVNELLLNFLHKHDPQPEIFAQYEQAIASLVGTSNIAACLRRFEIELLGLLGYALNLQHEAGTHAGLEPRTNYEYRVDQGPVAVSRSEGPLVFSGASLLSMEARKFEDPEVLRAAGRMLRAVIAHHLGGKELKSRKVLQELHRGRMPPSTQGPPASD